MFLAQRALTILEGPAADRHESRLTPTGRIGRGQDASVVVRQANALVGALRIDAALMAALEDDLEGRSPELPENGRNWIVKPLPGPGLAAVKREELDREELLANDSLGG